MTSIMLTSFVKLLSIEALELGIMLGESWGRIIQGL